MKISKQAPLLVAQYNKIANLNNWIKDIFMLSLFTLVFYLYLLGHYPFFLPDEARYAEIAREMIVSGDYITPRINGVIFLDKPILFYWLQTAAIHFFGIKEWVFRLFPVLFAILGCLVTYICGRYLFNRRTALLACILLGTSPLYFSAAHYANLDLEVAILISCSLLCFITAFKNTNIDNSNIHNSNIHNSKTNNKKSNCIFFFASYLFSAFAFLTKGLIGIILPICIISIWIMRHKHYSILKNIYIVRGTLLFALISLPWYYLVQKANPPFLNYFFGTQQIFRFLSLQSFNNANPFWFYLPVILIGFLPWTSFMPQAVYAASSQKKKLTGVSAENLTRSYLLIWIITIVIFFSIPDSKIITYILPLFPALALLTADYLSQHWEKKIYFNTIIFFVIQFLFAFGIVLQTQLLDYPIEIKIYFYLMAGIYLSASMIALFLCRQKSLLSLFLVGIICNILFLLTFTHGATYLNQDTNKPLISKLKKILKPQDEVISYFKFYQDVPPYLQRKILVVGDWDAKKIIENDNSMRELWYGKSFSNTDQILINNHKFWEKWHSSQRLFVFINKKYLKIFNAKGISYVVLDKNHDVVLMSNK